MYEYKASNKKQAKQQQQENDSDETNCDEDQQEQDQPCNVQQRILDLIRAKYNANKHGITLYIDLLCSHFKQLRFEYLVKSLEGINNLLDIDHNIKIMEKIFQSHYPIQASNGELVKTQLELVKLIDLQYNLKVQILFWISKLKQSLMNENNNIILEQLDAYYSNLKDLLSFYLFIFQALDSKIDTQHVKILWQIVFDNAFTLQEHNVFFQWLHTILYQTRTINSPLILTNESI